MLPFMYCLHTLSFPIQITQQRNYDKALIPLFTSRTSAIINLPCLGDLHLQTILPSCQQHVEVNQEKFDMLAESPPRILYQQLSDPQLNVVRASLVFPA